MSTFDLIKGTDDQASLGPYGYIPVSELRNEQTSPTSSEESTQDSTFSDKSDTSSQSSQEDGDAQTDDCSKSLIRPVTHCYPPPQTSQAALGAQQHRHPRRTSSTRPPPPLPRQAERKVLFVNDLVDSATAMVEAIWPLSGNTGNQTNGRGILPLRRYIEETLRRSRTSYSTLQVALYYLILIKSHVPKHDFTMVQPADCAMLRSMQCGRRMFLAALILASKYLQDRNYSAKAWSKMSGLRTSEINSNERMFLKAVNWQLHITDEVFKRWTDVVLRFTAPSLPPSAGQSMAVDHKSIWAQAMPFLTPELDNPKVCPDGSGSEVASSVSVECAAPAIASTGTAFGQSLSQASAPSLSSSLPRFLEPKAEVSPPTPALVRMGPLPTPQMTPSSVASNTPAASVCSSRRPSMSSAMAQAQNNAFYRLTIDRFPGQALCRSVSGSSAPSLMSSGSSPTSVDSDCSRSRSSSFGSTSATSTSAPGQAGLARLATCHVVGHDVNGVSSVIEGTKECPIRILDDADMSASPEISLVSMEGTCAKQLPQLTSSLSCRKRARSGEDVQARVRSMLQEHDTPRSGSVKADGMVVDSQISPDAMRRVWQTLSRPDVCVNVKGPQSLSSIHADSERVPICRDSGRKRTCAYVEAH